MVVKAAALAEVQAGVETVAAKALTLEAGTPGAGTLEAGTPEAVVTVESPFCAPQCATAEFNCR